tara:strand:+ start:413 stop:547 length:135 start_codon:yes stop_codon:yes gene_type:complete
MSPVLAKEDKNLPKERNSDKIFELRKLSGKEPYMKMVDSDTKDN